MAPALPTGLTPDKLPAHSISASLSSQGSRTLVLPVETTPGTLEALRIAFFHVVSVIRVSSQSKAVLYYAHRHGKTICTWIGFLTSVV